MGKPAAVRGVTQDQDAGKSGVPQIQDHSQVQPEIVEDNVPPMPHLENWRYATRAEAGVRPDGLCLAGEVYGHPYHLSGEPIYTSVTLWVNESAKMAQTQSRTYTLGVRRDK